MARIEKEGEIMGKVKRLSLIWSAEANLNGGWVGREEAETNLNMQKEKEGRGPGENSATLGYRRRFRY